MYFLPFLDDGLSLAVEECEKLVEGIEKIKKQHNKNILKTSVDSLSRNWGSCCQNIFETVLSCAAAGIKVYSSCIRMKVSFTAGIVLNKKNLCSLCDGKFHQKYLF